MAETPFDVRTYLAAAIKRDAPHCYAAHVPGEGYVNHGEREDQRVEYVRQYRRAAAAELENLTYASGYAEPGYGPAPRGVLFANWNLFPSDVDTRLGAEGYGVEWSDEWIVCEDCNRAFRTQPDGWEWRQHGEIFEHDRECRVLCVDCLQTFAEDARAEDGDGE